MKKIIKLTAIAAVAGISFVFTACGSAGSTEETVALSDIDSGYTVGESAGNIYTNTFFNIKYTMPKKWVFSSGDDLASINANSSKSTWVMYAKANDESGSANVQIVNQGSDTRSYTPESFIDSSISNLEANYKNMGYSDINMSKQTVSFMGEDAPAIVMSAKYDGKNVYQVQCIVLKGSYYACVTAVSFEKDVTKDILGGFSKAE